MIRIFIGYDPREAIAYHVLCHSILSRSTRPVLITPLALSHIKDVMWRPRHNLQSTDFSFSRFLVPYLCNFADWAIFMDCDMLVLDDIANLWELKDDKFDVMCVKHNHAPKETKKFLDQPQTQYEKKNWSSVMLFNSQKCTVLTPKYVNEETGLNLHRFNWVGDDTLIGDLPLIGTISLIMTQKFLKRKYPIFILQLVDHILRNLKIVVTLTYGLRKETKCLAPKSRES